MSLSDVVGIVAACLVLAAFSTVSMVWLRVLAVLSNIAFLSYGIMLGLHPIVMLHGLLLPLNLIQLSRMASNRVSLS